LKRNRLFICFFLGSLLCISCRQRTIVATYTVIFNQENAPRPGQFELAFVKNSKQEFRYFSQKKIDVVIDTVRSSYVETVGFLGIDNSSPRPRILSLRVKWDDSLAYSAIYEQKPERWNDWRLNTFYQTTSNDTTYSPYELSVSYSQAQAWFIVENYDSTRSYELRFNAGRIRDSTFVIPKGISARVVHRVSYVYFLSGGYSITQNVLNGSFIADIFLPQGRLRLDSTQWRQEYNYNNISRSGLVTMYCRYRIPAR
jgi:hypothetical protein